MPIRGINNHGGVKILPSYDTDGTRTSNALMASPEIYGRATCEDWKCDGCGVGTNQSVFQADFITTGTDENGNTNTTCETWYFY